MEINSISMAGATLQRQFSAAKTSQQDDQARTREGSPLASEARSARTRADQLPTQQAPKTAEQQRQAEASKVFVNAQGQKTGTIVSVTA